MTNFIRLHKNLITEITLLAAAALSVAVGGINIYALIFSLVMHELGHIVAALLKGAKAENFAIHGFGVEITFPGKTPVPKNLLFISAGGPIVSFLIAALSYYFNLKLLFLINISITIVNLLPVYPLDGGNILSCILSGFVSRNKISRIMKFTCKFFGLLISVCGIFVLYISSFNISLLYMGLFIFFSPNNTQNPVVEIISADYKKFEKSSLFVIDESLPLLEAAGNLPINSVGAVKDRHGKIISLVTPLYLYEMASKENT